MIELIVTLAILVIIATPLAGYFIVGAQTNRLAREQMEAGQLAQEILEDWKAAPMIGPLTPADSISGPFTISRQAVLVDRTTNPITYLPTQPAVTPGDPAPAPVPRAIENYQYSPVNALSGDAQVTVDSTATPGTYALTVNGVILPNISEGFALDVKLDTSGINNTITFSGSGIGTQTVFYTPTANPARVVFTMNAPAGLTINVTSKNPSADIFVFQGSDPATGINYPDAVTVVPKSAGIRAFEGLQLSPSGFNPVRVYQLTVTVTRNGNQLIRLEGYKEIQ